MIDSDENAPAIEALSPQEGDSDIAGNKLLQLKIIDDRAGLDFETLSITIGDKRVSSEKKPVILAYYWRNSRWFFVQS